MTAPRARWGWSPALLGVVLAAGLVLDLVWIRPEEAALRRLRDRRGELAAEVSAAPAPIDGALPTASGDGGPEAPAVSADEQVRLLSESALRAGVRQRELQMTARRTRGPVEESEFEMEVYGSFVNVLAFLRALELSRPLIVVRGVHMMAPAVSSDVTLRIQAAVIIPTPAVGPS